MATTTQKQRIFMTGAGGFVGSAITAQAIAQDYEVVGLARSETSDAKLAALGATSVRGDLKSLDVLKAESAKASIVIHLADAWLDNFGGPYETVERIDAAAVDAMAAGLLSRGADGQPKMLIMTSGTAVVENDPSGAETDENAPGSANPLNGRINCEKQGMSYNAPEKGGLDVRCVRLAPYVYGHGRSGVALFMGGMAKAGRCVYVGEGQTMNTSVHVEDAAALYMLVIQKGVKGGVYNASSETGTSTRAMVEAMGKVLGEAAASSGSSGDEEDKEKKWRATSVSKEEADEILGAFFVIFMGNNNRGSGAKARKELGWTPRQPGILEDIVQGSYKAVAKEMVKGV